MATRLLQDTLGPAPEWGQPLMVPWESSGVLTGNTVLKDETGWFGGIMVTATDGGGDIVVNVWDSPDATTTNDVELCRVTIGLTDKYYREVIMPAPGVRAHNGLYIAVAGDCEVVVLYR